MTRQYVMCLIFTDGDINDVDTTQDMLRQAENLPLSVMVIRVGKDIKNKQEGAATVQDKLELIKTRQKQLYSHAGQMDPKERGRDIFRYINYGSQKIGQEDFARKVFKLIPKQVINISYSSWNT